MLFIKFYMTSSKVPTNPNPTAMTRKLTVKYIIRYLQQVLNSCYKSNLVVDGLYGAKTKAAIRCLNNGSKGEYVIWLQKALNKRGAKLVVYCFYGSATLNSVKVYQKSRRLKAEGHVGVDTHTKIIND